MTDPQPTLGQQAVEVGGANVEDDKDWCMYVGTPWENDTITDRRDVDDFKEASRTIARTLAVRTCTLILQLLSFVQSVLRGLKMECVFLSCSRLPSELGLRRT
jgi:hypothetical protein